MATYLILNLIFLLAVLTVLLLGKMFSWNKAATATLVTLLIFTAIFDSLIIHFGIVAYDERLILGVKIGEAPIEDLFYAVLSVVMVVSLWNYFERKAHQDEKN